MTRSFMICTSHQILFGGKIKKNEMDEVCGRGAYWSLMGRPKEGVYFEDLGVDGRIMLKLCVNIYILLIFKVHIFVDLLHIKMDLGVGFGGGVAGTGLIWLRIVTGGEHL